MKTSLKRPFNRFQDSKLFGMLVGGLLVAAGVAIGMNLNSSSNESQFPVILKADSAATTKGISLATGNIDGQVEGLFALDHLTGRLQCFVLNSRTGQVAGRYIADVNTEFQNGKSGDASYVLVTGRFEFNGGRNGNLAPARSVCYVADGNSGKVVGYGLQFNRQMANLGEGQSGELAVVTRFMTREVTERDQ